MKYKCRFNIFFIIDKDAAEKLSIQVEEAVHLLSQYNHRLAAEMEHRKKVAVMMRDFLHLQEELLAQAERNLEVIIVSFILYVKRTFI